MQENGWNFYRVMPAPLEAWQVIVFALLFGWFVFGIVLWLRRKTESNAELLRLDPGRDPK